jgi:hypothetical protein
MVNKIVAISISFVGILHSAQPFFNNIQQAYSQTFKPLPSSYRPDKKPYSVVLYIAADNDLRTFSYRNLEEIKYLLKNIDHDLFHIFIHLDTHNPGHPKKTVHLVSYQKELYAVPATAAMDSGDEKTLIYTFEQAQKYCPSSHTILGLWNHGTGDLSPMNGRIINPSRLYTFDPETGHVVLNRALGFLDFLESQNNHDRAICFDETTHNFLSNRKVGLALEYICKYLLHNKKIDILFCDACLMGGAGFLYEIHPWVNIAITSQEVILAPGFRYDLLLSSLAEPFISPYEFAQKAVRIFDLVYNKITPDYTLSAIDLHKLAHLYPALKDLASLLRIGLEHQKDRTLKLCIKRASARNKCTSFDEPTYKDLAHFCINFLQELDSIRLHDTSMELSLKKELKKNLQRILDIISQSIIEHACGSNLRHSQGISIYIPEKTIHGSFQHCRFAHETGWFNVLRDFIMS